MQLGSDAQSVVQSLDYTGGIFTVPPMHVQGSGSQEDTVSDPANSRKSQKPRQFWSAADDLTMLRERRQKKKYAEILPLLQDPTRGEDSMRAHFEATLKRRLTANKKDFTLNAEWTAKYKIALGWAVREGVRVDQLSQWNSSPPEVRTLTSATIHQLQQLTYNDPTFKRVVDALSTGDHHLASVILLNQQELLHHLNRSDCCATDLWCCWSSSGFCPVRISTALHRAFESGGFDVSSLIPLNERTAFDKKQHPADICALLDAIMAHPHVQEFIALIELGFIPLRMASKLGEMERAGACTHKYVSFRIQQPVLNHRAQARAEAHYRNILGMPCYLANSAVAEVGYRGDSFRAASTQQMRVVVGKLLVLLKSFPKRLKGLPVGALYVSHGNYYTSLKTTLKTGGADYPCVNILDSEVCLYLVSPLLHPSIGLMYLHTKHRPSDKVLGRFVDCPFSIGGAGSVDSPWGTVTLNINHTAIE